MKDESKFRANIMKKTILPTLILVVSLVAQLLLAQPFNGGPPNGGFRQNRRGMSRTSGFSKNTTEIKGLLKPTVTPAAAATVRVLGHGRAVALGTVVAADGLVVTKASQLTTKVECQLADGRKLPATVVGQDEATDLALLHVDAKD